MDADNWPSQQQLQQLVPRLFCYTASTSCGYTTMVAELSLRWKRLTANSYFVIACYHSKKVTLGIKFPITLTWLCTFFSAAGSWETQGKRRAQWLEHLGLNL